MLGDLNIAAFTAHRWAHLLPEVNIATKSELTSVGLLINFTVTITEFITCL